MRKLAIFCTFFACAAAVYIWMLSPQMAAVCGAALLLCAVILLLFPGKTVKRCRIAAFGAALGLLWTWGYELRQIRPLQACVGENVTLTCTVISEAESTDHGCRVTARLEKGRILLYLDCAAEEISLGDRLKLQADVIDVSEGTAEGNLYYQSKDISLLGLQQGRLLVTKAGKLPLPAYPAYAAELLRQKIRDIFPDDAQGFALALLTGDRSELSYGQQNDLSVSGLSHVVAVSGMHISLLVGLVLFLFRNRRGLAAGFCIGVMLFFAAMLGFTPSVTRAVIMNSLLLLAPILQRENDSLTSLSFALWIILLFNPWAIANVSLQLSFGAMVGIFLFAPYFYRGFLRLFREKSLKKKKKRLLLRGVHSASAALSTSLGATVSTAPFVAWHFGTVSLISPLSNLLLLWLISLVFTLCFLACMVAFVYAPVGSAAAWLLAWPIRLIQWAAGLFADVPYAAIYTRSPYVVVWLVFVYVLFAVFLLLRKSSRKAVFCAAFAVSLLLCLVASSLDFSSFRFTAMDVGQGQCTVFQSRDVTVVIDCGGDLEDEGGEKLARKLLMEGDGQVDFLILTHYDADHSCGVLQLMDRVEVSCLLLPNVDQDSPEQQAILAEAAVQGIRTLIVREPMTLSFGVGSIRLFPPKEDIKNASLSALMSYEDYDILITGDMDTDAERQLLRDYAFPDIEVLVAGHHGSKYSTCEELLEATKPETVLICVGENTYGHPTQEVLDRIAAIGAAVWRTDLNGEILITG